MHRRRHLAGALGGIAGTGFSWQEVWQAKRYGQGNFSGGRFYETTYGPPWIGMEGTGISATGLNLRGDSRAGGRKVHEVAVDPSVIPLGSLITIWPNSLNYRGPFLAADTGGDIIGYHIDVYNWTGSERAATYSRSNVSVQPYHPPR